MIEIQNVTQVWNLNKGYKVWKTGKIKTTTKTKQTTTTTTKDTKNKIK